MYMDYTEIGRRIAFFRKARHMTQVEVENKAGLSPKYLSNIEHGRSVPSIDVLMQIADVLHTTPNELLLGAGALGETESDESILVHFHSLSSGKQEAVRNFLDWLAGS